MRKVPLKSVQINDQIKELFSYRSQLLVLLKRPEDPSAGATYAELEKVVPIIRMLTELPEDADHILLEEAQFEEVCRRVKIAPWGAIEPALLDFIEDVLYAEPVKVSAIGKIS